MKPALFPIFLCLGMLQATPTGTYRLREWTELPDHPRALAYDTRTGRLVATGGREGFGYLVQTDGMDGSKAQEITDGAESLVSIVPAKSGLFLTNRVQGLIQHVPLDQARTRSEVRIGQYLGATAMASDGTFLCVLSGCDWHPGVYDTGGALHILPIPLGNGEPRACPIPEQTYGEPRSLCISPDGRTAYVATSPTDYGSVTILSVDLGTARIQAHHTISEPCIWVSRDSLVLSRMGQPILAIDGRQESRLVLFSTDLEPQRTLPLRRGPTVLATSPDGLRGIVASRGGSCLQILDLAEFALGAPFPSPVECPSVASFGANSDRLFVGSSYVPKLACLEYSDESPPPLPLADSEHGEERIAYGVLESNVRTLWVVRPDGTDRRPIARIPVSDYNRFVQPSPDGRTLLYAWREEQAWDLFSLDLVTGESRRLTDVTEDQGVQCMGVVAAGFLPHGRAVVYELEFTIYEKALVVAGASGGPAYPLVDNYDDHDRYPVPHPWDPDRVLFLYDSGNWTFNREIRLFDRDTDSEWIIRPRDGHTPRYPVWSGDGKRIHWGRSGTELRSAMNLWSMRSDGMDARPTVGTITTSGVYRLPTAISPDGNQLLFGVHDITSEDCDTYVLDLNKGTLRPVVATADQYELPFAWQRIVLPPSPIPLP